MYEDHYGLTGRPFQLTPDPRFWFDTGTHRRAMSYLGYGLSQGEGFIVITGDIGAGKTTLVGHLLAKLDREQLHAISIVSTQVDPEDLLRIVATNLDVPVAGASKADLLAGIERGLHAVARSGRRTLLIVDEAQALPLAALEELRMLSNFSAGGHPLLQIFLLGQPEFRDRLEGSARLEQLRQRVIALHHLGPMELDEVEPYMAHRLNLVGWNGRPRFTGEAFEALHAGSGGIPRVLNQLAGRVLLHGAIDRLETIGADTVAIVVADASRDLNSVQDGATPTAPREPAPVAADDVANRTVAADDPVVAALRARLDDLEAGLGDAGAPDPALLDRLAEIEAGIDDQLPARLSAIEARLAEPVAPDAGLVDRIAAVETRLAEPVAPDAELIDRIAAIEVELARPVPMDPAFAERVAAVEARLAEPVQPDAGLTDRVTAIERRLEDQDATLRRILTLLVDWVENGQRPPVGPIPLRA